MTKNNKILYRASWISILGNTILSALKIVIGIFSGSLAVIGDGIDSATDIITSLITLFTARILNKPPDIRYPYGYAKADTIAARFLSFIIFAAGIELAYSTSIKLIEGQERNMPGIMALYVTAFSIIGKFIMARYLLNASKKTKSQMLKANAQNMQNDILISTSVFIGLIFTYLIKLPVIDSILALVISFWIIRTAYKIFMKTNVELMDGTKDHSNYRKIFNAVNKISEVSNPHRVRIRKMGNMLVIGIDIEVDGNMTVLDAHKVSVKVEEAIKQVVENIYDIVVHIEPLGNFEKHEKFGLSEADLN